MSPHIKRVHHVLSTMNEKYIKYIFVKFQNNKDKDIILKASRGKKQTHIEDYESEWYRLSQKHCKQEEKLQNSGGKLFPPHLQIHVFFLIP